MLIDIFARRYDGTVLRDTFEQRDSRLLVQTFRILAEDMYPTIRMARKTAGVWLSGQIYTVVSRAN